MLVAASNPATTVGQQVQSQPEIQSALGGDTASGEQDASASGKAVLYVAVPVLSGVKTLGAVRLTYPTSELDSRVNERVRGLMVVAGLTLLAAIGVAFLLAATITRPIRRLQVTTAQLASGDLTARATTDEGAPELRKLGRDLNTMSDRLNSLIEAQQSFAGDASHQLRTPLTALGLRLDQAAEALQTSPDDAAEPLDAARAETERLQHVVTVCSAWPELRANSRSSSPLIWRRSRPSDSPSGSHSPRNKAFGLELAAPASALILAVPEAPEQILDNYLDNALSVSPDGSSVIVTIAESSGAEPRTTTMLITDSGQA